MTKKKPKSQHKKVGRPTVMTKEVLAKLDDLFCRGYSDFDAYKTVGISKDAFYDYCDANPEYSEKKEWLKKRDVLISKNIMYDRLVIYQCPATARFVLERKAKDEYSTRTESTGKDGEAIQVESPATKQGINEVLELLRDLKI